MKLDEIDLLAETWEHGVPHEAFDTLRTSAPVHWHRRTRRARVLGRDPPRRCGGHQPRLRDLFVGAGLPPSSTPRPTRRWPRCASPSSTWIRPNTTATDGWYPRASRRGWWPSSRSRSQTRATNASSTTCARQGQCDFVADVAARLPLEIICEMIGLPESDWHRMFELSNTMVAFDDPELPGQPRRHRGWRLPPRSSCTATPSPPIAGPTPATTS